MRRVLITGSNRGIGLALVRRYLAAGDFVFATCRAPDRAGQLHALYEAHADTIKILRLDLLDPRTHTEVHDAVSAQSGAVDVLINNAGIYISDPTVAPEENHASIQRFDGMGSIAGKQRGEIEYGYSASKAALNMLARVLAKDVSSRGILVVTLDPGWVATDMGTSAAPLEPVEVADGLWSVIGGLDSAGSGAFLDWQGRPVPW
jgi:NAD(P)-dependent dehydrogenase (short-subunit alcohol dehydrogenase family)